MQEFYNKIIKADIVIPDYPQYSNSCITTLKCLLDKDQYNRITMDEILDLEWFKNLNLEDPYTYHNDILDALNNIEKSKMLKFSNSNIMSNNPFTESIIIKKSDNRNTYINPNLQKQVSGNVNNIPKTNYNNIKPNLEQPIVIHTKYDFNADKAYNPNYTQINNGMGNNVNGQENQYVLPSNLSVKQPQQPQQQNNGNVNVNQNMNKGNQNISNPNYGQNNGQNYQNFPNQNQNVSSNQNNLSQNYQNQNQSYQNQNFQNYQNQNNNQNQNNQYNQNSNYNNSYQNQYIPNQSQNYNNQSNFQGNQGNHVNQGGQGNQGNQTYNNISNNSNNNNNQMQNNQYYQNYNQIPKQTNNQFPNPNQNPNLNHNNPYPNLNEFNNYNNNQINPIIHSQNNIQNRQNISDPNITNSNKIMNMNSDYQISNIDINKDKQIYSNPNTNPNYSNPNQPYHPVHPINSNIQSNQHFKFTSNQQINNIPNNLNNNLSNNNPSVSDYTKMIKGSNQLLDKSYEFPEKNDMVISYNINSTGPTTTKSTEDKKVINIEKDTIVKIGNKVI